MSLPISIHLDFPFRLPPHPMTIRIRWQPMRSDHLFLAFLALWAGITLGHGHACPAAGQAGAGQAGFTLWQLPARTPTQHMAYVLRSTNGKIIVVDGGNQGDAEYLRGFLAPLGNRVAAWIISHPHSDHIDTLTAILKSPGLLQIEQIHGSIPEEAWIAEHEPQSLEAVRQFNLALAASGRQVKQLSLGQRIEIDGLHVDVLGIKNPEITANAVNNSSAVFRVADVNKSVLFTGDLGLEGGRKLLATKYRKQLPADYVQMAHHGQNGVGQEFYQAVQPRFCLWPTPAWLWHNDQGSGAGSGPWKTLEVRGWMDELNIEQHYLSARGLVRID
jgi:beta-lactamase superfamily II metal-dependent hydrolase